MNKKTKIFLFAAGAILAPVLLSPLPRFDVPFSTIVEARDGSLLGARIADDGQWRFPPVDSVPEKFEKAILTFEDRYFYFHPGINPVSVARAFSDNLKAGSVVRGGSTITMQVARLSGGNRPRTYGEKFLEMLRALKLELFRSKRAILLLYSNNAPFGGNCVGIEAASWRYTGKPPSEITWAEAAALAVLPNSPALVHPGRNQAILKEKRDILLRRLYDRACFDTLTLVLSTDEPLPGEPKPLPARAPHLTDRLNASQRGQRIRTTIDPLLQERAAAIVDRHRERLAENFIFNAAALIISVEKGEVLAYVGNSGPAGQGDHGGDVDMIMAQRSTGSIMKPLLYAAVQQAGEILPNSLIPDIPTRFPGFAPENFDRGFGGAVPAGSALSQSLNIPAVRLLQKHNPERFLDLLHKTGFTTFDKPAGHYGLSLILGGGETTLWELTGAYASLSRVLNRYNAENLYSEGDYHSPVLTAGSASNDEINDDTEPPLSAASIWLTYEALKKVNRPETETGWQYFGSSPGFAWKTGTSFGFRDAWAVGTTPDYVTGVWAGNADGEGRPGLTGIGAAAPILFSLAGLSVPGKWFSRPDEELTTIKVCSSSGYRAGPDCPETRDEDVCENGLRSGMCPWHRVVHLGRDRKYQVNTGCVPLEDIINEPWFVLPPAMEYFYRQKHPGYRVLPPVAPGCEAAEGYQVMEFIYPTPGVRIFIPRDHTGEMMRVVPEVVHRNPSAKLFWHLDDRYIGTTKFIHQTEILTGPGDHVLTVVDEAGNEVRCRFVVVG